MYSFKSTIPYCKIQMSASVAQVIEFSCTKLLLFALLEFHSKFPVYVVEVDMDISYEKVNEK